MWNRIIRSLPAFVAMVVAFSSGSALAQVATKTFNIPAEDLGSALRDFGRQSNHPILFSTDVVQDKATKGLQGEFTLEEALGKLLAGSGLVSSRSADGSILVTVADAKEASPQSGPPSAPSGATTNHDPRVPPTENSQTHPIAQIEEVIVTATRRSANLQDVPASITALNGVALERAGAASYQDYLNTVPSVSFTQVGARYNRVFIRGVSDGTGGDRGPNKGLASTTGLYLDDVPLTSETISFDPSVYDVERVEVLRGPQGTLYGSGSMGGAVRLLFNRPVLNETSGTVEESIGNVAHGGSQYRTDAVFNAPLVPNVLGVRAVVDYRSNSGFINDIGIKGGDANWRDRFNGRVAMLFEPTDRTRALFTAMYQNDAFGAQTYHDIALPDYEQNRLYPENGKLKNKFLSLSITHDAIGMSFTSVTGYIDRSALNGQDATTTFIPLFEMIFGLHASPNEGMGAINESTSKVFSQEVRLVSSGTSRIDWLVGGFYSHANLYARQVFDTRLTPTFSALFSGNDLYDDHLSETRSQEAAFGEVTFHASETLSLSGGVRVSRYKTDSTENGDGILNGGPSTIITHSTASKVTQKYLLAYKFAAEHNVYVQAAQGFRDGGGNEIVPFSACAGDLAQLGYNHAPSDYKPDSLWSYEVGTKNTFGGRRLSVNGAAYYIDWKDIQTPLRLPVCRFSIVANAGAAVVKGFELEVSSELLRDLTIKGSIAYADSRITSPPATVPAVRDSRLPLVPKWTLNVNAEYRFRFADDWSGFMRADVNRMDSRWSNYQGLAGSADLPSYTLVGARVGIEKGSWSAALYGTNLTDTIAVLQRDGAVLIADTIAEPRVVGLTMKYQFH